MNLFTNLRLLFFHRQNCDENNIKYEIYLVFLVLNYHFLFLNKMEQGNELNTILITFRVYSDLSRHDVTYIPFITIDMTWEKPLVYVANKH